MELASSVLRNIQIDEIIQRKERRERTNYKNGGITLPDTQFVGPGNRVVDKDNKSNFNSLPDNCLDWIALEHDVDYHNNGNNGNTDIQTISTLDDKAIDNAFKECKWKQLVATAVLAGFLKAKQHFENLAESITWPFGKNKAIYPPPTSNTEHINWFDKNLSRRRNTTGEHGF